MKRCVFLWLLCLIAAVFQTATGYSQGQLRTEASVRFHRTGATDSSRMLVYVKDTAQFLQWVHVNLSHIDVFPLLQHSNIFSLSGLRKDDYRRLKKSSIVQSATTPRKAFPEREVGGIDFTLNSITTVHDRYPLLDGNGMNVSVKENAFDKHDIDFHNRILNPDEIPSSADIHATTMATIIGGAGNSSPDGRGVAAKPMIAFADFDNLSPENTDQLRSDGITVQNHSYGVGIENFYGIETHLYDKQCYEYPELLHVFSSGNNGDQTSATGNYAGVQGYANLTGQFKMSKSTLSVGSTNKFGEIAALSSRGPAYDGRIKPEVVAHGDQGTSEAAALVSGISLLLQQTYRDSNEGELPPSSLIRAALVNSADDNGRTEVDYEYGFGLVDALGSIETIVGARYFLDDVENEETKTFVINVPANSHELKVTLAWTDEEAEPEAAKALINDLDLEVFHVSSAATFAPWSLSKFPHVDSLSKSAERRADHVNTIEQITITSAPSGNYAIRVKGYDVAAVSQSFSVVYEIEEEFQWIYPSGSDVLVAGETKLLRWKWNGPSSPGTLQWRIVDESTWQTISEIDMRAEYFNWNVPSVNDVIELRLSWGTSEFVTDPFRISGVIIPSIGYYCDPDGVVFWDDDGSESYNVYILGEKFLELSGTGTDTIYYKPAEGSPFMVISSVVKGKEGRRSRLVDLRSGLCYITSFLPEKVVTDSVALLLTLGTNIGVSSFDLERMTLQGPVVVQTVKPVTGVQFKLYDPSPLAGSNYYQIRLRRDGGEQVVSHIEEVFFVREDDLQFFPNPVAAGEPVTVIVNAGASEFWIQDMLGKTVNASYDDAEVKTIETSALVPGIYIIKSVSSDGRILTGRIVIK